MLSSFYWKDLEYSETESKSMHKKKPDVPNAWMQCKAEVFRPYRPYYKAFPY